LALPAGTSVSCFGRCRRSIRERQLGSTPSFARCVSSRLSCRRRCASVCVCPVRMLTDRRQGHGPMGQDARKSRCEFCGCGRLLRVGANVGGAQGNGGDIRGFTMGTETLLGRFTSCRAAGSGALGAHFSASADSAALGASARAPGGLGLPDGIDSIAPRSTAAALELLAPEGHCPECGGTGTRVTPPG